MDKILKKVIFKGNQAYFLLNKSKTNPKREILELSKKYKLNIKQDDIDKAIKTKEKEFFLSDDISIFNEDESFEIVIASNKMSAEIKFSPAMYDGAMLTKDKIMTEILNSKIKYGVEQEGIDEFLAFKDFTKRYICARGKEPTKNTDGTLKYNVDINVKKSIPKVLEDGYLDYKSLELFQSIKQGSTLVTKIEPIKGEDGTDVTGGNIICKEPKPAPPFPMGKNTEISEDGSELIASIDGCIFYQSKKISVMPTLEIGGDVDNSTGNINFIGTVDIKGNVLTGFSVVAEGDINIKGCVEGAHIKAGGDIVIGKGVQGGGRAVLISGGDIKANFVESATLDADKNITTTSLMHCNTNCGLTLRVIGKKGIIVGGKTVVGGDIYAADIGSIMSNNTEINVGITPKVLREYERLVQEIEICYSDYKKQEKIVEKLSNMDIEMLSDEKKVMFVTAIKKKLEIKKNIANYKKRMTVIMEMFIKRIAKIEISNILHSQTKIIINNAIIFVKEEVKNCVVKNIDGKIKIIKA